MVAALRAYPGGLEQQRSIVAELKDHARHDRLVKGLYWEGGKGCAVGCTIKSGNHIEYEERFGIPVALARLEDTIFEALPNVDAMKWPVRFMLAAKPGADLRLVQWKFLAFVVREALERPEAKNVREACWPTLEIIEAASRGELIVRSAAESAAWSAARSAAWSAESAAESAAWSAARSAESAAWSAAESAWSAAARSAESAARSARSAARSAWSAAWSAESAAWSAAWSAESAAWKRYANKLIEFMEAA